MRRRAVDLLISWSGQSDLCSLRDAETPGHHHIMQSDKYLTGLYLNELLVRVLQRHDPHPELYQAYQQAIQEMSGDKHEQVILRVFEKKCPQRQKNFYGPFCEKTRP